jgi:hypothetical protein
MDMRELSVHEMEQVSGGAGWEQAIIESDFSLYFGWQDFKVYTRADVRTDSARFDLKLSVDPLSQSISSIESSMTRGNTTYFLTYSTNNAPTYNNYSSIPAWQNNIYSQDVARSAGESRVMVGVKIGL